MAYVMYILRDAVLNELHFDGKNWAPKFNFRSPNHAGRVNKNMRQFGVAHKI